MGDADVAVGVRMWLRNRTFVRVQMVFVVDVEMFMLERGVSVLVAVPLDEQKRDSRPHDRRDSQVAGGREIAGNWKREHGAHERRGREVGGLARGAEQP